MAKIDEQISYNWLFFLLAGAFGAVTFWAVYDETATRREYKGYQETFFGIETSLAKKAWDEATADLQNPSPKASKEVLAQSAAWKKAVADLKRLKDDLGGAKASEYQAAKAKLQEVEFDAFDKNQNYTFTKSNMDEAYYYFTVAKHEAGNEKEGAAFKHFQATQKVYTDLIVKLAEDEKVMNLAAAGRDCLKKGHAKERLDCQVMNAADYAANSYQGGGRPVAVDAYTDAIAKLGKQIDDLERPMKELERKYLAAKEKEGSGPLGMFGPATEIIQANLEEMGRVDRCESCHVGANKGGLESISPKYFRSHPYRRTLLSIHPVEKFGCTTCHDGQGRATTQFHAHAPTNDHHFFEKHFWEQPLLKGAYQESQCRQCHRSEYDLRANLRCEVDAECPKGTKCAPLAAPLNASAGADKTLEPKIEDWKYCGTPNGGEESKIDPVLVDLAPHLSRGRKIIEEAACYGCHPIEGYESRPKAGPDLRHAAAKLNPGWMVAWILQPKAFRPNTRMPNFFPERLHLDEYPETAKPKYIDGLAELAKITDGDPEKRRRSLDLLTAERFQPEQQAALMTSFLVHESTAYNLPTEAAMPAGDAGRGEKLVDTLGCYGCHNVTKPGEKKIDHPNRSSHYDHGPDLGNVGAKTSKAWIFAWVKDPKSFAPETRMPNLRLTDQEASDIATFLAGNKFVAGQPKDYPPVAAVNPDSPDFQHIGKKLVNFYGCYGCHLVKGFEQTAGIGAELTEFGLKETSRLDYGDYIVSHTKQTWEAWLENKLKHPRVYRYERVDTRMPQFDLTTAEIEDVMVVMKGMRGKTKDDDMRGHKLTAVEQQREKGRELVRYYNCNGCHSLDGRTGDIRSQDIYQTEDGPRFAPPLLIGEGAKTQPQWLFGFLRKPTPLRPHLSVRMPTFGLTDGEATTLTAMFSAFDGADFPYHDYSGYKLEGDRKAQAQSAFKAAQCVLCHTLGEAPSPELAQKGAPNLLLTKSRLRGDWLARWIRDPALLYPGVNMPSFFSGGNPLVGADKAPQTASLPGIAEIGKMDAPGVIYLLRDLLMTLEPAAPQATTPAKAPLKKKGAHAPAAKAVKHAAR
ncbi:MAG: c-type cytochrome [Myxococcales bacterium]|nr:c-type cytochrome [Myxococcales bacterium]